MFSVIHEMSTVGLPNHLTNQFGSLYAEYPTAAQAAIMQEIAWQTVCHYQRDGVDCSGVVTSNVTVEKTAIRIYPVPAQEYISIHCQELLPIQSVIG